MSATKLTRREQRARAQHFIDTLEGTAFPNSKRIYITGTHPGVRVPMREIQLSPTLIGGSKEQPQYEENEAIPVYDTSGPYGDPQIAINVQQGLAKLRQPWIDARGDTEELTVRSSDYTKARLADDGLDELLVVEDGHHHVGGDGAVDGGLLFPFGGDCFRDVACWVYFWGT